MSFELALQEIQRHVKVYKAFQEAENALIALASLEQHTKELEASRKVLEVSLDKIKAEVRNKQKQDQELDSKLKNKEVFVKESLQELEAQKLLELTTKFDGLNKIEEEKLKSLQDKLVSLEVKVTGYNTYLGSKQQELSLVESRITAAKEQMQRMLNGSI